MSIPPGQVSGRHAKPRSRFALACDKVIRSLSEGGRRRRLIAAGSAVGTLALVGVVVTVTVSTSGGHAAPAGHRAGRSATPAANATQIPSGPVAAESAAAESTAAVGYFTTKDTKVAGHVQRVTRDGQFLRVYTDYPEEDANSTSAISLCDWSNEFLNNRGDTGSVVFIHGTSSDNGSVVLANKVGPTDNCKVDETR